MRDYPKFVKLGHTEMELQSVEDGVAYYWREMGAWGINAKWAGNKLITYKASMTHLKNRRFTLTEDKMDMGQFESEVEKAIRKAEKSTGRKNRDARDCNGAGVVCKSCIELGHCSTAREFYAQKKAMQCKVTLDPPQSIGLCKHCSEEDECHKRKAYLVQRNRKNETNNEDVLSNTKRKTDMNANDKRRNVYVNEDDGKMMRVAKGVMDNGTVAVTHAKEVAIMAQVGGATLASVKLALDKMPIPQQVKDVLNLDGYGDAILGMLLDTLVPTLTQNEHAIKAAQYANSVGIMRGSEQFTVVSDTIKMVVESAMSAGAGIVGAMVPEAGDVADEDMKTDPEE